MRRIIPLLVTVLALSVFVGSQGATLQELVGWNCDGALCVGTGNARELRLVTDGRARLTIGQTGVISQGIGSGTELATGCGTLDTSTTEAQTAADLTLTTLYSYTIPANTINQAGRGVRIAAWGKFGSTANTKNLFITLGNDTLFSRSSTGNNVGWSISGWSIRLTATTHFFTGDGILGTTPFAQVPASGSEDFGTNLTLAVKSQNGTAAAGDTVFQGALVECF